MHPRVMAIGMCSRSVSGLGRSASSTGHRGSVGLGDDPFGPAADEVDGVLVPDCPEMWGPKKSMLTLAAWTSVVVVMMATELVGPEVPHVKVSS